jgi:hypothetical protein
VRTTVTSDRRAHRRSSGLSATRGRVAVLALSLAAIVAPASAHHSFAMFDPAKMVSQQGVVTQVDWTNPHVWLHLAVKVDGKEAVYSYEGAAIAVLKRVGWTRDSVKPGQALTVVGHPYKDGRPGGSLEHVLLPDGTRLGTGDAIPGALVPATP